MSAATSTLASIAAVMISIASRSSFLQTNGGREGISIYGTDAVSGMAGLVRVIIPLRSETYRPRF
jgi:hypothetical protein